MRSVLSPILRMTNPCFHLEARLKLKDDRTLEPMSPTPPDRQTVNIYCRLLCTFPPKKKKFDRSTELAKRWKMKGNMYFVVCSIMCQRHRQPFRRQRPVRCHSKQMFRCSSAANCCICSFLDFFSQSLEALRHLTTNSDRECRQELEQVKDTDEMKTWTTWDASLAPLEVHLARYKVLDESKCSSMKGLSYRSA